MTNILMRGLTSLLVLFHVIFPVDSTRGFVVARRSDVSDSKVIRSGNSKVIANTTAITRSHQEITQKQEKEVTDKKGRIVLS